MRDVLTYKGFMGSVHFSAEDKVFSWEDRRDRRPGVL